MHKILIVDDSPTIRKMVRASLKDLSSAEFIEAATGLEAIEQLAVSRVQIIVLDLNMPDMHGLEVLGFIRANTKFQLLPVIVLTTRGDESSRTAALQAGATRYLTKPFTPTALLAEARSVLQPVPNAR
jgi:two-component system, chemotaxis family, chemotaxis protein CheY